jgi:uncharacterized protein YdaU (DUF1376 family)
MTAPARSPLAAEWFWIDRWRGSTAWSLPIDARGLYREMLTAAWSRGAALPNDHIQIQRLIGVTPAEWRRGWPVICQYWRVDGALLVNDTQREVYAEAMARFEKATARASKGGQVAAARRRARGPRLELARR